MNRRKWKGLSFEDIDMHLCTLCGTCISACPVGALEWQHNETIAFDRATCIACAVCYAVCPPQNPQGLRLSADSDPLIGPSTSLYRGFAADTAVREAGSPGGFVTALLVPALEQGVIDIALVVAGQPKGPTRPQITVARTPEGIRATAQSKYCLAPVNATLDQIRQHDGKLAVVALPCQAHGIRLAQSLNLPIQEGLHPLLTPSLAGPLLLTILAYTVFFFQAWLLAQSLALDMGIAYLAMCLSIAGVITLLPISLSGLGTRDAILIVLFTQLGSAAEQAVAFSALFFLTFYVGGGLIGGLAWQIKPLAERPVATRGKEP